MKFKTNKSKWINLIDQEPIEGSYLCFCDCEKQPIAIFHYVDITSSLPSGCSVIDAFEWYREGDCECDPEIDQYGFDKCSAPTHWMPLPKKP